MSAPPPILPDAFAAWLRDTFAAAGDGVQVGPVREPVALTRDQVRLLIVYMAAIMAPADTLERMVRDYMEKQP